MARSCRSGLRLPLAAPAMMSRAREERLWLRTKSAFSLTRTVLGPASSCSTIGMARSGSLFISPRSASSFSSSLAWPSGETWSAGSLADLDIERLRVLGPAALRKAFPHIRERRERVGALIELPLRVRLPVERGVGPRAVRRGGNAIERLERAFVAAGIDQLTSLIVPPSALRDPSPRGRGAGLRPRRRLVGEVRRRSDRREGSGGGSGGKGHREVGRGGTASATGSVAGRGWKQGGGTGWADATWPARTSEQTKDSGTHSGHIVFLGAGEAGSRSRSRSESTRTRKSRAAASSRRRI